MKRIYLTAALSLLSVGPAFAWGQEGHSIVAEIAQRRLTPKAEDAVEAILKGAYARMTPPQAAPTGTVSLSSLASWPDGWRPAHPETGPWHFVDIPFDLHNGVPPDQITYEPLRDCTPNAELQGVATCVVDALAAQLVVLKTPASTGDADAELKRWQALQFVVHFSGDLAQPFHCIERDEDQGGNKLSIKFEGKRPDGSKFSYSNSLHGFWDTGLIQLHVYDWGSYVTELEGSVIPELPATTTQGTIADWANECHLVGIKAYKSLPPGTPVEADRDHPVSLTNNYSDQVAADLGLQLARGGVRLAFLLNQALDPASP